MKNKVEERLFAFLSKNKVEDPECKITGILTCGECGNEMPIEGIFLGKKKCTKCGRIIENTSIF